MDSIKTILMKRDGMTETEAKDLIKEAKRDFNQRMKSGEDFDDLYDFCSEWFGLEPDYLEEFLF